MGWHGVFHVPMFQIRIEGRLHYHSASVRDPPHANATRGLLRYQSNLNTYLLLRCYYRNFLLLKSFFAKLVTLRGETRDGGGHREQSASGTGNAVATWLYS